MSILYFCVQYILVSLLNNNLTKMYCTQKMTSEDTSEVHSTSNGINYNMSVQTNGTISETRSTDIFITTL
jgi:hypothetical protein